MSLNIDQEKKMSKTWSTVIKPKTGLFSIPFREIYSYRGLIFTLVKRNYEVQYKQTILGPAWMILSLIFSSGIFSFVFGYVGNFSSDGTPYFLFYMTGSIIWDYFSMCFSSNTGVLLENSYLFGKVYFPRLVVPISNVFFNLIKSGVKFLVCVVVWIIFFCKGQAMFMGWYLLLIIPLTILTGIMGMSAGLIVSCMTIKYRDFNHLTGIAMQLLLYASPVLYSVKELPHWLQKIVFINPMSSFVEAFRFCMTGSGMIHWEAILYSVIVTILIGLFSLVLFNQTERTFIDII